MKTVPILLSLAMGVATAQQLEGSTTTTTGNIRAAKVVTDKTKHAASAASSTSDSKQEGKLKASIRPSKNPARREQRSQRKNVSDGIHKMLFDKDRNLKESMKKKTTMDKKQSTEGENAKVKGREDHRELKKAKSDKGGGSWGGSSGGGGGSSWGGGGWNGHDDNDDHWNGSGGHGGNDDEDDDRWNGSGGNGGNYGGRFDVDDDWHGGPSWHGGGKSGKGGSWGGSGGGKSGKGGYSGKSGKMGGGGGGSCDDEAYVTITNLSYEQSFSEIFIMTHTKEATWRRPIFIFGNRTNEALAELAQDADASEMMRRYENRYGVEQTKVFRDFRNGIRDEDYLRGGARARLRVRTSGDGHRLSLAAGLPFTNDGAIVLEGAHIYDGAEYWLPVIDVGAEGNIQTCWSVAAKQEDFPPQSECADDEDSDINNNDVPGENFVSLHRGMHDFDDKKDLQDLLFFPECSDYDLDKSDDKDRFATYFYESGYDDEWLLCKNPVTGGNSAECNLREDDDFLKYIDRSPIHDGEDDRFVALAADSDDFDDFCDNVKKANDDIEDALKQLEPWLFDWRGHVAHVEISCGWNGDGYHGDWRQ